MAEPSDVPARTPVLIAVATIALIVLTLISTALVLTTFAEPQTPAVSAFRERQRAPAAPDLEVNPAAVRAAVRAQWQHRLQHYGWVDRGAGIVRVPIEVAIDRLAAQAAQPEPGPASSQGAAP